jgi:hypothetical protein
MTDIKACIQKKSQDFPDKTAKELEEMCVQTVRKNQKNVFTQKVKGINWSVVIPIIIVTALVLFAFMGKLSLPEKAQTQTKGATASELTGTTINPLASLPGPACNGMCPGKGLCSGAGTKLDCHNQGASKGIVAIYWQGPSCCCHCT